MKLSTAIGPVKDKPGALAVFLFDDEVQKPKLSLLNAATLREVRRLIKVSDFKGESGAGTVHFASEGVARIVLLVGLGSRKEFEWDTLRLVMGDAVRKARDLGAGTLACVAGGGAFSELSAENVARAAAEGAVLGNYRYMEYRAKAKEKAKQLESVVLHYEDSRRRALGNRGLELGRILAEATNFARDLGTHPSNVVTPTYLAEEAKKLAKSGLKVKVLEQEQMAKAGMNALLAVAKGSAEPPKLIILEYRVPGARRTLAFVGKGVTFDSGGISIKPSEKMDEMKMDMCGAAAVLAAMKAVPHLKPKCNVIGLIPAVENLPSSTAYKPGDILTAMNGKTIEIITTDAEGRLILADAMVYGIKTYKPSAIVDIATLTGACVVALGHYATGLFSNRDSFRKAVERAGDHAGEKLWQLPLYKEYTDDIQSDVADIKNAAGRYGGACTAAAFLQEFVGKTPWAHLDIAGTAMDAKVSSIQPKSVASGAAVRTLLQLAMNF
jgi:leucyl aminopeptidase